MSPFSPAALVVIPINLIVTAGIILGGWRMMQDKYLPVSPVVVVPLQILGLAWIWITGLRVCLL